MRRVDRADTKHDNPKLMCIRQARTFLMVADLLPSYSRYVYTCVHTYTCVYICFRTLVNSAITVAPTDSKTGFPKDGHAFL